MAISSCCSSSTPAAAYVKNESAENKVFYINVVKNITRVAVLALLAVRLPVETAIGFTAGVIAGAIVQSKHEEKLEKGDLMQLCVLGYLQFASDSKWDEWVVTAFTAASFVDSAVRGSTVWSTMMASGVGYLVGKELAWLYKSGWSQEYTTTKAV